MTTEEHRLNRLRHERIARVKRILRWMPRRSNMHRYPVLKWFARAALKRSYLWSFRVRAAVPALYAGCILALLPLYGTQLVIAVGLAFLFKANLPMLFSLQFITNPVTLLPAYYACFQIGKVVLDLFGIVGPALKMSEMKVLIEALRAGDWGMNVNFLVEVWAITFLGGVILGTSLATIAATLYKFGAYEVSVSYARLKELQQARSEKSGPSKPSPSPAHNTHPDG